eukprot:TRINITY_DN452_c0_g2_i1.p1 TRINITY_DN452_c0_g2~~TRINITY_DN452_c0_g2_i1.p1  ORF type:complete len:791 (+),score=286.40 TRINITY_DN452_c0_g2_i1:539-2911(+)
MADNSDLNLFLSSGIDERRANETLKNPALTKTLSAIISKAKSLNEAKLKDLVNLYYSVATTLPASAAAHRDLVVEMVANEKLHKNNLDLAFKFLKKLGPDPLDVKEFERECGVGVVITRNDVNAAVAKALEENKAALVEERYRFPTGPLLAKVRDQLKFANPKDLKDEFDAQILAILGPKTEKDNEKPAKKKEATKTANPAAAANQAIVQEQKDLVRFPEPHENKQQKPEMLKAHLDRTKGVVVTRFPPEPNGYLHLGHAKSMNLNFSYAAKYGGYTYLRYDDTNPAAEKQEYIDAIADDVKWMGHTPKYTTHASDYFQQLYELAIELIKRGKAYVDHQTGDEIKEGRRNRTDSPWRNRSVEENLELFEKMKTGGFEEGTATLRMKMDMKSENPVMRDLIAYRIKKTPHPHVGDKWIIYPSYDYTHCLNDSMEDITHSLCTLEFERRRESYNWLIDVLDLYRPLVWECSRLNVTHVVLSKRKLILLVDKGLVTGWDDPRMPTIRGLRRRGYTPEAINDFCNRVGVTRNENFIEYGLLEQCLREDLDVRCNRVMAVLEPLKVTLTNYTEGVKKVKIPNNARDPTKGDHEVSFSGTLYIERSDFRTEPLKGYKRLILGQSVGLSHVGYTITAKEVTKDEKGNVTEVKCTVDFKKPEKGAGFIHWVAESVPGQEPLTAEVRLYEHLFTCPNLAKAVEEAKKGKAEAKHADTEEPVDEEEEKEKKEDDGEWLQFLNPNSLVTVRAYLDESARGAKVGDRVQFERNGYFAVDTDSTPEKPVWNRIVGLKEANWEK